MPEFDGPAVASRRLAEPAVALEGIAEIVVCLGVIGRQFQGPLIGGDGPVQLPLLPQDISEVVVRWG